MTAYAAIGVAFWAGLIGATYFACVLGARLHDAHQRGVRRIHNDRRTTP